MIDSKDNPFIVICNGPSLKGFDFDSIKDFTTIGLNASYRKFKEIGFKPNYYCSADERVGVFHAENYAKIADEEEDIDFFLLPNACDKFCASVKDPCKSINNLFELNLKNDNPHFGFSDDSRWVGPTAFSTGYIASLIGISLGFKEIILLGADCNYVELIKECKKTNEGEGLSGIKLTITETPKENPNYWFNDYQQKNDEYHVPNGITAHMKGWLLLSEIANFRNVKITNCSEISKIPFFPKLPFDEVLKNINNKSKDPKFSIVTPSYNQAQFLKENITSVQNQDYQNFEQIICDPGSTDGSLLIETEYASKYEQIKLNQKPDNGQSDAINKAWKECDGDILCWLNSDDYYPSNYVLKQVKEAFEQNPDCSIVYGRSTYVDKDGTKLKEAYINKKAEELPNLLHEQVGIVQPSTFIKKEVFEHVGPLNPNLHYAFDYEYWIRTTLAGFKWFFLDETLSHHRWHDDAKTSKNRPQSLAEAFSVSANLFRKPSSKWLERIAENNILNKDGLINGKKEDGTNRDLMLEKFKLYKRNILIPVFRELGYDHLVKSIMDMDFK